jgi:hypothetical protein
MMRSDTRRAPREGLEKKEDVLFSLEKETSVVMT